MKLSYKNITEEVYALLKEEIAKIGVEIEGDKGDITTKGIRGRFDRNPEDNTLEIVLDRTPFVMPKTFVAGQISKTVTKVGGDLA